MMTSISYRDINITGGFWQQLQQRNKNITMPAIQRQFTETGRFAALDFSTPWAEGKKPHIFWDSDLGKWIESVAYILQKGPAPELEQAVEAAIALIEKHQDEDGYYNIYFTVVEPEKRWQNRSDHELYCAGHLMEAAVAYYEATGRDKLLRCMMKYADYIEQVFVKEQNTAFVTCGHEEIELALVRLYRCTGEERYLRLSEFFVDQRGANDKDHAPYHGTDHKYCQSHLPVREQREAVGHSVRAMYLYCAMADLAAENNDKALWEACKKLFENTVQKRMYVTGGIGSTHHGEAFTVDYDLPNETAYAETCAAIGLALFARRMSAIEPDNRYADVAELAIYNGLLPGLSEDGTAFFYENPLEIHPQLRTKNTCTKGNDRYPITQRQQMFDCMCCPPNFTRLIASFGDFLFAENDDTLYVHHYAHASTDQIELTTEYPREGNISLRLRNMAGKRVALRIPGWCENYNCSVSGELDRGYYYINTDSDDFVVFLSFEMPVRLVFANAKVYENIDRVAVMRGPVVYCMEALDNGKNLRALSIAPEAEFTGEFDHLECDGFRLQEDETLYSAMPPKKIAQRLRWIPYYRFANREESEMAVWVRMK